MNPKFSIGEAVQIKSKRNNKYDSDFSIVTAIEKNPVYGEWGYQVHNREILEVDYRPWFKESGLYPIPPEQSNGIDALGLIQNLNKIEEPT